MNSDLFQSLLRSLYARNLIIARQCRSCEFVTWVFERNCWSLTSELVTSLAVKQITTILHAKMRNLNYIYYFFVLGPTDWIDKRLRAQPSPRTCTWQGSRTAFNNNSDQKTQNISTLSWSKNASCRGSFKPTLRSRRGAICNSQEMSSSLASAKCWYVDSTFKLVRNPFKQLLNVNMFSRSGEYAKQVPAFVLMSGKKKKDYKKVRLLNVI